MHHSQAADNLVEGTEIAGYIIDEKIGKGGMGSVYRAKHLALGREIALKVLSEDFCRDEDAVSNFFKEARSVANLRHKNIIQAYDVGTSETGLHYFAMELVEGRDLNEIIHDFDKVPEDYAISIAMDMAAALKHAWHRNSLSHGDIKPENIMYTFDREVKITDFGLSRSLHDESVDDDIMLTPAYAAPELISRTTMRISPSTDIYSFGITLYHMLAGHPPFEGDDYQEIYRKHLNEIATPLSSLGISKYLSDFVEILIQKDPHDRFDNWDIIFEELEAIQSAPKAHPIYMVLGKIAIIIAAPLIVFALIWFGSQKEEELVVGRDSAPLSSAEATAVSSTTLRDVFESGNIDVQGRPDEITPEVLLSAKAFVPSEEQTEAVGGPEAVEPVHLADNSNGTESLVTGSPDTEKNEQISPDQEAELVSNDMEAKPKEPLSEGAKGVVLHDLVPKVEEEVEADFVVDDSEEVVRLPGEQDSKAREAIKKEFMELTLHASSSYSYYSELNEVFSRSGISNRLRRLKAMLESIDVNAPFSSDIRERILFLSSKFEHLKSSYRMIVENKDSLIGVELKAKPLDGYVVKSVSRRSVKLYKTMNNISTGESNIKMARIGKTILWKKASDNLIVELLIGVRMGGIDLDFAVKDSILMKVLLGGSASHFRQLTSFEDAERIQKWNDIYYDMKICGKEAEYGRKWDRIQAFCKEGYVREAMVKLMRLEKLTANSSYYSRNEKMFSCMKVLYGSNNPLVRR